MGALLLLSFCTHMMKKLTFLEGLLTLCFILDDNYTASAAATILLKYSCKC